MDDLRLFLSYNSVDRSSVLAVQKLLEARGVKTFLDRDQLGPGLPWPQALEEALRATPAVAVFLGRELGGWQKREMWFALERQVSEDKQGRPFPVIPVLLPGADPTPGFLSQSTWIDLRSFTGTVSPETLDAFEHAIRASAPEPATAQRGVTLCPYRGLEAFREEDAAFFAGRAKFAADLLNFTLGKPLVALVGPSGSGKSSVVKAGLVPLLRRQVPPATTWDVAVFTPGSDPFHRLAAAVVPFLEPNLSETDRLAEAQKLGERLAAGEVKLESAIDRLIQKSNGTGRLLLIADQFEELFTLTPQANQRPFAAALVAALGKAPFTILLTLRADFYSQIITLDRQLSDRLTAAQVNIGTLTRDELRESVICPAKLVGLDFEAGLVDRILDDAGSEPGNLPLLEFALTGLWSKRQGRTLTNAAYDEIGGVARALAQRAESEFARFNATEQTAARRFFSRLVRVARPEEGAEDTRQRLELRATDALTEKVVHALAGPGVRLLVLGRVGNDRWNASPTVEIAHEALIRNWERLRGWLNEDREFLLWRQRTQIQVELWEQHGHDQGYLLRGLPLSEAERWHAGRPQDLTGGEQQFIEASVALREQERAAEEQRRRAELENEQRLRRLAEEKAKGERQSARNLRRLLAAAFVMLVLAIAAAVFALWQRTVSRARELAALSAESLSDDPETSILLGIQAVNATARFRQPPVPAAADALHQAILSSRVRLTLRGHSNAVTGVAFSPDGKRLATASGDETAKIWDAVSGQELLTLRGHSNVVTGVAFSPDGKRFATASRDQTAKIWDAANGQELLTLRGHSNVVTGVAFSPDGKRLATASRDQTAKIWDAASGQELPTLRGHSNAVTGVAFSPDGKRLATASGDQTAKIWDAASGQELLTLRGYRSVVTGVAFSPDGERLATASEDQTAKIWDAASGQELLTLRGHSNIVTGVAFSPDGKRLATASRDKTAKIWDAASGQELLTLRGHSNFVYGVAFRPDGKRLATASWDQTAKIWDAASGQELLTLRGHSDLVRGVAFSPDGKRLATASWDKTAKIWDAASGHELLTLRGHSNFVYGVAFSPDGKRLATASQDQTAKIWDAASGQELLTLRGHSGFIARVAFSPDAKRLATASEDKTAKIWDTASGQQLLTLRGHSGFIDGVAFSPDAKRLATASWDKTARIWDAASGQELLTLRGHSGFIDGVAFSPDGKRLATASLDQTAKIWDAASGHELLTLRGHSDRIYGVAFSPDGKRLATASGDKTAKIWDAASGQELLTLRGHSGAASGAAFSPDGKRLASASWDATVQVYALDVGELLDLARRRVTRTFTPAECQRYFPSQTCPDLP